MAPGNASALRPFHGARLVLLLFPDPHDGRKNEVAAGTPGKEKRRPLLPAALRDWLVDTGRRLGGLGLLALVAAGALALWSHSPLDPDLNHATGAAVRNWLGRPGAHLSGFLFETLGLVAPLVLLPPAVWGGLWLAGRRVRSLALRLVAWPFALSLLALAAAFVGPLPGQPAGVAHAGGLLGEALRHLLETLFARWRIDPGGLVPSLVGGGVGFALLVLTLGLSGAQWRVAGRLLARLSRTLVWPVAALVRALAGGRRSAAERRPPARARTRTKRRRSTAGTARRSRDAPKITARTRARSGERAERERQGSLFRERGFALPPLDLLSAPPPADPARRLSPKALEANARLLESVLEEYGIQGEIRHIRPGPVVTLYELEPAPGTKSARVIGLAEDIARSMSAISARIAVVPGRNAIGIELPNSHREPVHLREILESRVFERSKARLPLALGKDIGGEPVVVDLATMPHLLVAGTTGSGKSVGLNAMIISLLARLTPEECRLILVDPKMLELSIYEGIPHLLTPVVTEPKKAVVALKWAVHEMEERYRAMARLGVRNLVAYNERLEQARRRGETLTRKVQVGFDDETGEPVYEEEEFDFEPLPMIVVVIDEMADLMLVAGKEVEATVQRLAQMARAAGIHLIMATQRPSVDVITGTIKANFPTRISFQVTSKIDSRTILGEQGAEQLLGRGDMLFMAGGGRIGRVHGAYVSEDEVERVVAHLRRQRPPSYREEVTREPEEGYDSPVLAAATGGADDDASLYDRAVAIVLKDRRVSTSYIQRRLRIGYNRAASLIEEMEAQGVISAPNRAGKREILVPAREEE